MAAFEAGMSLYTGFASLGAVVFAKIGSVIAAGFALISPALVPAGSVAMLGLTAAAGFVAAGFGMLAKGLETLGTNWYHRFALRNLLLTDSVPAPSPAPAALEDDVESMLGIDADDKRKLLLLKTPLAK